MMLATVSPSISVIRGESFTSNDDEAGTGEGSVTLPSEACSVFPASANSSVVS